VSCFVTVLSDVSPFYMFRWFLSALIVMFLYGSIILHNSILHTFYNIEIVQYICVMETSALTLWCLTPLSTILQFGNIKFNIIHRFLVRFVLQNL
jgi:hypothetical protein